MCQRVILLQNRVEAMIHCELYDCRCVDDEDNDRALLQPSRKAIHERRSFNRRSGGSRRFRYY